MEKFLKSQGGFSLLQVMVAGGLAIIIIMAFMNVFSNAYKTEADLKARQEAREFADELYVALSKGGCGFVNTIAGETFESKKIEIDLSSNDPVVINEVYGIHGQPFKPGVKYGNLTFSASEGIKVLPVSTNSLLLGYEVLKIMEVPAAERSKLITEGGYIIRNSSTTEYLAELAFMIEKPQGAGGGTIPLRSVIFLEVGAHPDDAAKMIIKNCRSIPEVRAAKAACLSTYVNDLQADWDDENFKCTLSIPNTAQPAAGSCLATDPCGVDGAKFVTTLIPAN